MVEGRGIKKNNSSLMSERHPSMMEMWILIIPPVMNLETARTIKWLRLKVMVCHLFRIRDNLVGFITHIITVDTSGLANSLYQSVILIWLRSSIG